MLFFVDKLFRINRCNVILILAVCWWLILISTLQSFFVSECLNTGHGFFMVWFSSFGFHFDRASCDIDFFLLLLNFSLAFARRNGYWCSFGFAVGKLKDFWSESSWAILFQDLLIAWSEVSSDVGKHWGLKSRKSLFVGQSRMFDMNILKFGVLERGCGFSHFVFKRNKINWFWFLWY